MSFIRQFPLGPIPLLLAILCGVSGAALFTVEKPAARADLEMWVFAGTHFDEYQARLNHWPSGRGSVRVQNLGTAHRERLALSMLSHQDLPDLFEIEHQELSFFLRGPA